MRMTFTFGSLFAGIGGFDLGLERMGMSPLWQVEIDDFCTEVLERHWPNVKKCRDIRDCGTHNLQAVDLICGGFPCQDISIAGRREGLDGKRSGLWFEFIRIIEELRPKWVVIENVPGLLSSNEKRDFAAVLSGLGQCGYWWAYRVLDAQFYGIPQRRRRVFIVGCLAKECAQEILFERESSPWDSPPGREAREKPAYALAASVRGTGDEHRQGWNSNYMIAKSLNAHAGRGQEDNETFVYQCHGGNVGPMGTLRKGDGSVQSGVPFIAATLNSGGNSGGFRTEPGEHLIPFDITQITSGANRSNPQPGDPCHPLAAKAYPPTIAIAWQQGVSPDDRSYPVRAGDYAGSLSSTRHDAVAGRFGVRRLTPTECERLQGFPDGWTAINGMKDSARYRMLGNAVCVPVIEWIGRRILETETK